MTKHKIISKKVIVAIVLIFTMTFALVTNSSLAEPLIDNSPVETEAGLLYKLDESKDAFYFNCGDGYYGEFADSKFSGEGEYEYIDVGTYTGNFENGVRSSKGSFLWDDGGYYTGEWKNDTLWGTGKYTSSDSSIIIQGDFYKGSLHDGTITIKKSKNKYTYTVSDGNLSKKIKIVYSNGCVYSGAYQGTSITGTGTMKYKNGDKYTGKFENGKRSGTGTYKWKNGAYYKGKWSADKMSGSGTYYYAKSSKGKYLKGTYKANKPTGTCTYKTRAGKIYKTVWSNGKCTKVKKN